MKKDDSTGKYEVPDLYSVSGSADFRNQTHNGLCVHREFGNDNEDGYTMVYNLKTKYDFQGTITAGCKFNWNNKNRRFYTDGAESNYNLINRNLHVAPQEVNFSMQPNTEFDCPF
jgi:twinkle protein